MDPEYAVIGRVARRIWARAMRERYGASAAQPDAQVPHPDLGPQPARAGDRSSTTSARRCRRSTRIFDNCNSLHTNAYDEAITTPTEESVRRAVAIQLIINRELGLNMYENPLQGSFVDRGADRPRRGGRLRGVRAGSPSAAACSARWTRCTSAARSRTRASTTSTRKHDGSLPIVGVNTFLARGEPAGRGDGDPADALDRGREGGADRRRSCVQRRARRRARRPSSGCSRSRAAAATSSVS